MYLTPESAGNAVLTLGSIDSTKYQGPPPGPTVPGPHS